MRCSQSPRAPGASLIAGHRPDRHDRDRPRPRSRRGIGRGTVCARRSSRVSFLARSWLGEELGRDLTLEAADQQGRGLRLFALRGHPADERDTQAEQVLACVERGVRVGEVGLGVTDLALSGLEVALERDDPCPRRRRAGPRSVPIDRSRCRVRSWWTGANRTGSRSPRRRPPRPPRARRRSRSATASAPALRPVRRTVGLVHRGCRGRLDGDGRLSDLRCADAERAEAPIDVRGHAGSRSPRAVRIRRDHRSCVRPPAGLRIVYTS